MTKSAKIHVNKCQNAKKRNLLFADVSISSFLKVVSFADFCFLSPKRPPRYFLSLQDFTNTLIVSDLYFADFIFCIGK